jgi:glycosyltransferase involved in cell wall biosynthesis
MKYFGTIAGPFELSAFDAVPKEGIYGMTVFARRFIRALLRFGDFDELHVFYSGLYREPPANGMLASDPRIRLLPLVSFAAATAQYDYHAFHNIWSPDIGPWTDLRNRLCGTNIPITGLTHTISYQSFLPRTLATMILGSRPWDSIVCTTESARIAMREWIAYIREEFSGGYGTDVRFDARLDRIPLAVDPDVFQPGDRAELRARLDLPPDRVLGLYFGRFSHYDKIDLFPLLLAFRKALENCPEKPLLVIAGSESFHKYSVRVREFSAELGIRDSVILRTDLPDDDVPALCAAADFFVSPSDNLQETFGQSIIEAMASGLPVICSDWNGYKELVLHEETGYRVRTYWMDCNRQVCDYSGVSDWIVDHFLIAQSVAVDVPAMAASIARLASDEPLRRTWGGNGRRRVLELFTWRSVIARYLSLWRELREVAQAAPPPERNPGGIQRTWYRPEFFRTFRHYPTRAVAPADRISPGLDHPVRFYPELASSFQLPVFEAILSRAAARPTVADLSPLAAELSLSPDVFDSHLLWLIKYGHLNIE